MKSLTFPSLLVVTLVACAQGTTLDTSATDFVEPKESAEPTEPENSVTLPADDGDEDESGSSSGEPGDEDPGSSSGDPGSSSGDPGSSSGDPGSSSGGPGSSSGGPGGACATVAPSHACGLAPQCGCAAGQTCDVTGKTDGAVSCVAAGNLVQGASCTATTQCATGLSCAYGTCRPHCATVGAACAGAGLGVCGQLYDPPGTAVPNAKLCTVTCDLRSPSGACGSNTCIWDGSVKATDCDATGGLDLYDPCTSYNACKPGLACAYNALFGYECERWCRVGKNDCGALETCEDIYGADAPTEGADKLGHCQ